MKESGSRVEICGGIASGKTTLARLLARARFTPVLEEFKRNPFLAAFYLNPGRYALETELGFLLQHFHAIKQPSLPHSVRVCDFSFVLDHAYAKVTLTGRQQRQFQSLLRWLISEIGEASVLIHLVCPAHIELQRIRKRRRRREQAISETYLADINGELADLLTPANPNVLVIDSHAVNFATNASTQKEVLEAIKKFVRRRTGEKLN